MQDRDILTMEDKWEIMYGLSNGMIVQWPWVSLKVTFAEVIYDQSKTAIAMTLVVYTSRSFIDCNLFQMGWFV